jgi:hypothetical protein
MATCRGSRTLPSGASSLQHEAWASGRCLGEADRAPIEARWFTTREVTGSAQARSRSDRAPHRGAGPPGLAPEPLPARGAAPAREDLRATLGPLLLRPLLQRGVRSIGPGLAPQRIAGAARGMRKMTRHELPPKRGHLREDPGRANNRLVDAGRTIALARLDRSAEQRCFPLANPRPFTRFRARLPDERSAPPIAMVKRREDG